MFFFLFYHRRSCGQGVFDVLQENILIFREPGFREALFVRKESSLFDCNAILMVIGIYEVAGKFETGSPDIVLDAVTETARVEERLALAVVNRRPWLAVRVDAPLEAGFDSCNPSDADLIQPFLDVRVCRAEVPDFAHQFLQR